jgi:hypothetical protein
MDANAAKCAQDKGDDRADQNRLLPGWHFTHDEPPTHGATCPEQRCFPLWHDLQDASFPILSRRQRSMKKTVETPPRHRTPVGADFRDSVSPEGLG